MKKYLTAISFALLAGCYSPEQYEASTSKNQTADSDFGTLFEINGGMQICNPSVTQDEENYPASMLWLNFSGTLNVEEAPEGYSTTDARTHGRLTISDTAGKVLWYLMKNEVEGVDCEFQDPEWTTDGNFIVTLGASNAKGSKGCDELNYGILAVRLSDKKTFFLADSGMDESSNPHLWIGNALDSIDGKDSLANFFGTNEVKLVYMNPSGKLVYVDYAKSSKAVTLKAPSAEGLLDGPMISPDGKFIVYDVLESSYSWSSYVQELSSTSSPVEIEKVDGMISNPVFPHWWKFGSRLFIVWTEFAAGTPYLNKSDLTSESTWDASIGRTAMREVTVTAGAPSDVAVEWNGDVREIAPIPLIGGRSPSGHFVSTGTNNGYMLYIP